MKHTIIFIVILSAIVLYFDYSSMYEQLPVSTHQWRQSDGTSMALNYYQNGMNFWKPQHHNMFGVEGYSVGEFPGLYYITACLYHVFGVEEGLFRLVNFLLFSLGLLALSKLILKITDDDLLSFAIPALLMASPLIGFYAFNFLPDTSALGFVFIAWYFFYSFYKSRIIKWLYLSSFFFLLGGLFKVTALLTLVPIMAAYFLELIGVFKFKGKERLFSGSWLKRISAGLPFILAIAGTAAWYLFAIQYNETNHTTYFRTYIGAIWTMDQQSILYTFKRIFIFWGLDYFHWSVHILTALLLGWITFTPKRHDPFLYFFTVLSGIGVLLFVLMFLAAFDLHDYYMINLLVLPVLVLAMGGAFLRKKHPSILNRWKFKFAVVAFVLFNFYHAKQTITSRYAEGSVHRTGFSPVFYDHENIRAFLKENGVEYPEKVLSMPDRSPNSTLYYMNLRGWTELYNYPFDAEKIKLFATFGAKYLIVSDTAYLSKPELQLAFIKPIANYKRQLFLFDIQDLENKKLIIED